MAILNIANIDSVNANAKIANIGNANSATSNIADSNTYIYNANIATANSANASCAKHATAARWRDPQTLPQLTLQTQPELRGCTHGVEECTLKRSIIVYCTSQ